MLSCGFAQYISEQDLIMLVLTILVSSYPMTLPLSISVVGSVNRYLVRSYLVKKTYLASPLRDVGEILAEL